MPQFSWNILLPISMTEVLYVKIFLILVFNSGLLTLPELSQRMPYQNISHPQNHFKRSMQVSQRILCDKNIVSTIRVCIMASSPQDFGNDRNCDRVLVFTFNSLDINIYISKHDISMPNATIKFDEEDKAEVPIYREEITSFLHIFYTGHLVFNDISLPFTGIWDGYRFKGKVIYARFQFELLCTDCTTPHFYMANQCLSFVASCKEHETTVGDKRGLSNDDFDFLSTKVDSFQSQEHASLSFNNLLRINRKQRSVISEALESVSCGLHLVADHLFFKYVGGGSVMKTVNIILNLVNEADAIFRSTDFDGNQQGDNIGFVVGKITVFRHENHLNYKLFEPVMSSEEYLLLFSEYDFSSFCLGIGFTFRDFYGTTGTAYPGFSDNLEPGGICQVRVKNKDRYLSYNTLIVTFLNEGKMLTTNQVMLTLLHELGHSFGASHDSSPGCIKGEFGSYIMNEQTNRGTEPNNHKFSHCSIVSMLPVIKKRGTCFIHGPYSYGCGNGIPEEGEECDCGLMSGCEAVDPCCTPADIVDDLDKPCTLRRSRGKVCSPKVYPCCSNNCTSVSAKTNQVCNELETCREHLTCDGQDFHCPSNSTQLNGTMCNNGLHVCSQGECSVEICEYNGLFPCMCINETDQCKLCCKETVKGICLPVENFPIIGVSNRSVIYLESGAPCLYFGTCDSFHFCHPPALRSLVIKPTFRSLKEFVEYVKNSLFFSALCMFALIFTIIVCTCSYQIDDPDYVKALRYGKMIAVFSVGEFQTKVYRKILLDIDDHYSFNIYQILNGCEHRDLIEALGRLKMWFPTAPISHLSQIAKMSASEHIAVKILLLQGFKMRTFTK